MFRLEWHRDALRILEELNDERLAAHGFLFAGGTRLALELDEFRESQDIDFLCSDRSGYADLRNLMRSEGYRSLFSDRGLAKFTFPREIRTDQYGIRFLVQHGEKLFKIELIREGRIELTGGVRPSWSPVACLGTEDCWAVKLLANSDRWPDRQVLSRDLIDLAAMRWYWDAIPLQAWKKAEAAYKAAVRDDLRKALASFAEDEKYRERCFRGLRVEEPERILAGLKRLRSEES